MTGPRVLPYLLIAPSILFLGAIFLLPLAQTVVLSLTAETGGFGLDAYARMAGDLNFLVALRNTFGLVLVVVPLQVALALAMGLMIQKMTAGRDVVLWIWTIPLGISDLAAGLVWLVILSDAGYLNSALYGLGVIEGRTSWLSYEQPMTLFLGVVLAEVWRATAVVLVVLVAGLQLIPKDYAEAAEVFGADAWRRFRTITLPLMKPSLQSALILRTVLAFEVFGVVYALGGRNLPVLVGEAYLWQRENQNYAVAAAYAVLIMVVSLAATALYLRLLRTPEEARP